MFKLISFYHIIKTVIGDDGFKFFKMVKILVTNYNFTFKIKTIIDDYGFNHLKINK